MYRGLFYFFFIWHLVCMLVYNVSSTVRGYHQLTEETGPGFLHRLQHAGTVFTSWPVTRRFAQYAGTATGYGFFAPQVGSSFRLVVTALDAQGIKQTTVHTPQLKQPHSVLRYHSLLNRLQNLLQADDGSEEAATLSLRQARAIAHCLARRIAQLRWGQIHHPIRCEVFVYDFPALRQHDAVQRGYRISIYRKLI